MRITQNDQKVIEQLSAGLLLADTATHTIIASNSAVGGLLGLEPNEIRGRTLAQILTPRNDQSGANFSLPEIGKSLNWRFRRANGDLIQLEIQLTLIEYEHQEAVLCLLVRDVSAQRHAEAAQAKEFALLKKILHTIPDLIWVKDREGAYLACNPRFERFFGAREAEIVGKTDYDFVSRDQADFFRAHDRAAIAAGQPTINEEQVTYTDDGHHEHLETIKTPMIDPQGQIIGVLGIARDITALRHTEEALRTSQEALRVSNTRLTVSNQELQEFVYVASHDLQEPLRKVATFGERLKEKFAAVLGDNGRDYLERMLSATVRMQTLIEDLLLLSRVNTTAQQPVIVDLNKILTEVLSDLEIALERTGGKVIPGPLPQLLADPTQMRQLLQNLIGNALKFHRLEQPPQVNISAKREETAQDNPRWHLTITDNGIGFDQSYAEQIFQPFARLHGRSSGYHGTGIGLTVCRKIVLRHHGEIWAESRPGFGASFHLLLPATTDFRQGNP